MLQIEHDCSGKGSSYPRETPVECAMTTGPPRRPLSSLSEGVWECYALSGSMISRPACNVIVLTGALESRTLDGHSSETKGARDGESSREAPRAWGGERASSAMRANLTRAVRGAGNARAGAPAAAHQHRVERSHGDRALAWRRRRPADRTMIRGFLGLPALDVRVESASGGTRDRTTQGCPRTSGLR